MRPVCPRLFHCSSVGENGDCLNFRLNRSPETDQTRLVHFHETIKPYLFSNFEGPMHSRFSESLSRPTKRHIANMLILKS